MAEIRETVEQTRDQEQADNHTPAEPNLNYFLNCLLGGETKSENTKSCKPLP